MGTYDKTLLADTIARSVFEFDEEVYVLASLRPDEFKQAAQLIADVSDSYIEIILDKNETSIVVTQQTWDKQFVPIFGKRPMLAPLTRIFCNVDATCTGYLLTILDRLSPNDVGIYVQGAYVTDHIFIHSEDIDKAKGLLGQLQDEMRQQKG